MSEFESRLAAAMRDGAIAGAVMVAGNASGTFCYERAVGASDQPYQVDSPMKIMSCTKLIVSICALQCVERGLIGLDDDVFPFLPGLARWKVLKSCKDGEEPVMEDVRNPVTLRLLLTHSAGTVWGSILGPVFSYRKRTGSLALSRAGRTVDERHGCPFAFQPGEGHEYGSGHDWALKLVEILTKTDADSYIKKNIASRLGITSMTFWPNKDGSLSRVPEAVIREGAGLFKTSLTGGRDNPYARLVPLPHRAWDDMDRKIDCFGGGGLTSSTPDYLRVLRSLLANDGKLLKSVTVDAMFVPCMTHMAKAKFLKGFHERGVKTMNPGEYPDDIDLEWGLGGVVVLDAMPGWRGKGTLMWSGMANHLWFIDRENDVCGVFATQLLLSGDDRVKGLTTAWEKEMHRLRAVTSSTKL